VQVSWVVRIRFADANGLRIAIRWFARSYANQRMHPTSATESKLSYAAGG